MNQQEKYELLTKLSEFYVKEVRENLACFNKAKFISCTSIAMFWILFLSVVGIFVFVPIATLIGKTMKIEGLEVIFIILPFVLVAIILPLMEILKKMDKENGMQVFKVSGNSTTLPMSADNEIKKRLMSKFVTLFGDFTWCPFYSHSNFKKRKFFGEGLNILNSPLKFFDDCISGSYKGVNLTMVDGDTSVFKVSIIAIAIFLSVFICIFLPVIGFVFIAIALIYFAFKYFTSKQFKGLIVEIDMNKSFEGHTFILEKDNLKDNLGVDKVKYQEVKLEDVEFSEGYNVYSQNQIEARYLLTTAFIERIKKIKETFKAKYVRVSFKDKKIVILIHTGRDMFNLASFISDIGEKTFVQCFEEICSVLDLVEILKLNEKLGL